MFAATARTALRRCAASATACGATAGGGGGGLGAGFSAARALSTILGGGAAGGASSTRSTAAGAVSALLRRPVTATTSASGFHSTTTAADEGVPAIYEDKNLSQVLHEELEHERETYKPNDAIENGPPAPWISSDDEGDCEITLTRTYGDNEEISVVFNVSEDPYDDEDDMPHMPGEEEEEDDDEGMTITFSVSVTRADGQESLEFACATDGQTVEVRNVRYDAVDPNGEEYGLSSYPGPNYDELDESVQEEFHKYLEARGIDETLANYIMESYEDKEQKEYMGWLHNVSNFVSAGKK